MLYVTTRSGSAAYTAQTTMDTLTGPEGGLFVPMKLPVYDCETVRQLAALPFWSCVAHILNQFFPLRLTGSELEKARQGEPELVSIRYKIAVAQLWNRTTGSYGALADKVLPLLGCRAHGAGSWPVAALDIAMLFGLYGSLCRSGRLTVGEPMNPVMAGGSFRFAAAAMYAAEMGLPVGNTVCVCNENSMPWELLHKGEARLDGVVISTKLSSMDEAIPVNLERLIAHRLGIPAVKKFTDARERKGYFSLDPDQRETLKNGFFISVVRSERGDMTIRQIYKNSNYLMSPHTAVVYCGLTDFRSLESEGMQALLLSEESPMRWGDSVLGALMIPVQSVTGQIDALEREAAARRKGD